MHIRRAGADDVPRLVELLAQMSEASAPRRELDATHPSYARAFADIAADPRQRIYVVDEAGALVGSATLVLVPNLSHGGWPFAFLKSVVVDAAHRGRGIGERLVRFCIEEATGAGCYRVQLTTLLDRERAQRFYRRLGFTASHLGFTLEL